MGGRGGSGTWAFRATRVGSGALRLGYGRSFEPGTAPAETFSVPVAVR